VSPVYETAPVGTANQPLFLNAAALIETHQTPRELKRTLQMIEQALGRVRAADKNAPRTVDLDISLFGDQVLEVQDRHIPDPEILQFVHIARPLADLKPRHRHPETGQTLLEIAQSLPAGGIEHRQELVLWPLPVTD
jgi:2-amino-4-hydroxy-6-hydroxymethyldihydropteridine diphosphokinase